MSIRIHDQYGGLGLSVSSHSAPTVIADDAVTVSRHVRSPRNGDGDRRSIGNAQYDISGPVSAFSRTRSHSLIRRLTVHRRQTKTEYRSGWTPLGLSCSP